MKQSIYRAAHICAACIMGALLMAASAQAANLIPNGGYERGIEGWGSFWTRTSKAGEATLVSQGAHSGKAALRIVHRRENDWSLNAKDRIAVRPGELYELRGWADRQGEGDVTLCVTLYDAAGGVIDWSFGDTSATPGAGWQPLRSMFVIPTNGAAMLPRWIGHGPVTALLDDVDLQRKGDLDSMRAGKLSTPLGITNSSLSVQLNPRSATLTVRQSATGRTWTQRDLRGEFIVNDGKTDGRTLTAELTHLKSGLPLRLHLALEPESSEFLVTIEADGALRNPLPFPHPFISESNTYLVVPMNEGISYPVNDSTIEPMRLIAYGGHGICMAFWGATDGQAGQMAILETPDDAAIRIARADTTLYVAPEWDPQFGKVGYARKVRYVFFNSGGHVAMCKRYRQYAREQGLLKTLAQKRAENPNVDLLVGAVNVWCWDRNGVEIVREMKAAGIDRILWSNRQSPDNLKTMNELGVLTSRYDIFQDVMNPANFSKLNNIHGDWVTAAWPHDIVYDQRGNWIKGWAVKGKDGQWYPCGVICDRQAVPYARQRIPAELATHPYRSRFIDTTTAAPWHECYHTNHPMTRTDSRRHKMALLEYVSKDCRLVTGCETGHDASVPFLHYFEGMLSLGPYRVPDSGRDIQRIWTEVPERVAKFQLGHAYRLPLWELVYHDCVVAQWYWGDYNNKLPALWDKRDLFNVLYATPPMFMFNRDLWAREKARFVQSYRLVAPVVRDAGYSEMVDHRFLTPDRAVQQTAFANGLKVTVNFGDKPFSANGRQIPPGGTLVDR